jgi:WD repeat-containing protein 61
LACGSIDGFVNIFDIQASKLLHSFEGHAMPIRSIAFAPNSQVLCTASDDNYIKVFDV